MLPVRALLPAVRGLPAPLPSPRCCSRVSSGPRGGRAARGGARPLPQVTMLQTRLLSAPAAKGSTPFPARPFRPPSGSAHAGAAAFTCAGPRGRGCQHPKAGAERPPRKVEERQGTERYGLCRRTRCPPGTSKGRRQAGSEPASGSTKEALRQPPQHHCQCTRTRTRILAHSCTLKPRAHTLTRARPPSAQQHSFLPGAGVSTGVNCPSPRGRVSAGP